MNNSNNFNVCSRCGSANSLSAKYCYQCGSQLKVPDEPIVCPKCNSINSSMANFCRACGTTLKTGAKTKVCPRCRKHVAVDQSQCACGYSFATVRAINKQTKTKQKGGRLVALLSLLFTILFAFAFAIPFASMQNFATMHNLYLLGYDTTSGVLAMGIVDVAYLVQETATAFLQSGTFKFDSLLLLLCLMLVFTLTLVVQLVCALIRLAHGKRGKRANVFYLIMALLTGAVTALFVIGNLQLYSAEFLNFFILPTGFSVAWGIFIIPAFYLFFFVFSLFAKGKKQKS